MKAVNLICELTFDETKMLAELVREHGTDHNAMIAALIEMVHKMLKEGKRLNAFDTLGKRERLNAFEKHYCRSEFQQADRHVITCKLTKGHDIPHDDMDGTHWEDKSVGPYVIPVEVKVDSERRCEATFLILDDTVTIRCDKSEKHEGIHLGNGFIGWPNIP